MVAHIYTVAFTGLEAQNIDVQIHVTGGMPAFTMVGLPDKAVAESRERVRAALHALGLSLPPKRITINLSPANILKEGSHYDLPIALGLIVALEALPQESLRNYIALGELSLDGAILPIPGILPAAIAAQSQSRGIICPKLCGSEARWAGDIDILAPETLLELVRHLKGEQALPRPQLAHAPAIAHTRNLREVRGQHIARRALEIAAAGKHNLLMSGPPGAGKSLLAACLPGILPALSPEEMLETSMIASLAGQLKDGRLSSTRPFRDPHHSASLAAMVGGGRRAKPGEISLAHHGVLFLDELPEFQRGVLEALRQPLEARQVTVARAEAHVTYPANFQLIAAMNPCRCGYLGDAGRECGRAPKCAQDYGSKLSGPLLDRIDMHIEVAQVPTMEIFDRGQGEDSASVAKRVLEARTIQNSRFGDNKKTSSLSNADLQGDALRDAVALSGESLSLLRQATERLRLSMRGVSRVLRVARTIADLEQEKAVQASHIAEALSYRQSSFVKEAAPEVPEMS